MKTILPLVAPLAAMLLSVAIALPAAADQLVVTVPYHDRPVHIGPNFFYSHDYNYGNPYDYNYDPAAAAINAYNNSHMKARRSSVFNIDRAITLNYTGDSMTRHQEKCQARYASYDMISDTYLGDNGIPRHCRL